VRGVPTREFSATTHFPFIMSSYPSVSGAFRGVLFFGAAILSIYGGLTGTAVAGDLLRGGYSYSTGGHGGTTGSFTPPGVARARQNAKDLLARTSQAISAVVTMQNRARGLAQAGGPGIDPNNPSLTLPIVPNGLNTGGLVPDSGLLSGGVANPVTTWSGATTPTQTVGSGGKTVVNINQNAPDATLNWTTFNIGKGTTVDINQSAGGNDESKWIAFNFVNDPSAFPSQILGSIHAGGQVYVIDQNGIIFGGSSQINVHTLVASSLPMDTYLISRGLLNNPDDQFLFSAVAQPAGTNGSPAFTPPASYLTGGADGDVIVEPGASIYAPANAASVGGRVALIGPNVDNQGSISTPDGQTILAAGLQVAFVASTDATLRGLVPYVGEISDPNYPSAATAGLVSNEGLISVPRGDATMVGATVDQLGVIGSTTSVTLNGRIDLDAQYGSISSGGIADVAPYLPQSSGAVELGANSVTEVMPEVDSAATVTLSGYQLSSEVNIQGETIHLEKDSTLTAPSGTINLDAGSWFYQTLAGQPFKDTFVNSTGQVYLDSGAIVSAAGSTDVEVPVGQNIISLQLLGPELADSPSQRNGLLQGQTIFVDIRDSGQYNGQTWVGTPLVDDASSFAALVEYTVAELTVNGGSVNINAGGSVVMQAGSQLNVSGGWIDYQGGIVSTTEVISDGHIYPISEATPNLVYQGFNLGQYTVNYAKYGISNTYIDPLLDSSHYENSYVNGGNGGVVAINSPSVALDGQILGNTVAGPRQQTINQLTVNSLEATSMPTAGAFELQFQQEEANSTFGEISPTPPSVIFASNDSLPAAAPFAVDSSGNPLPLSAARQAEVILSPDLFTTDGFGLFELNDGDGNVTIPSGVSLNLAPSGGPALAGEPLAGITISAANLNIGGSITDPGGNLTFSVYDYSPFSGDAPNSQPAVNPTRGLFVLDSGATLNTAGLIVDDRDGAPLADQTPQVTQGGTVTINSYSADLAPGSVINVSGGVTMSSSGAPKYGNAGKISISGGRDPGIGSLLDGAFSLGSELEGYSGAQGGSLSITAQFVQIGGAAPGSYTQLFDPGFFDQGGFTNITLSGIGGLTVEPGAVVNPEATSLIAVGNVNGDQIDLVQTVLPAGERPPVNLTLKATGATNPFTTLVIYPGNLVLDAGAVVESDPSASAVANITLSGGTVAVLGTVIAPAGNITISGATTSAVLFPNAGGQVPTVDLGPGSLISSVGTTEYTPNNMGYITGAVLNGGSITVSGNIVAEAGSVLNVSGASAMLDVTPVQADVYASLGGVLGTLQNGSFLGTPYVLTEVDSNGGSISLQGDYELFSDASLLGTAGGPGAIGGTLSISSGAGITNTALDVNLVVMQNTPAIPIRFYPPGQDAIGHAVLGKNGQPVVAPNGQGGQAIGGYITVDSFAGGGFENVDLAGTVDFSGPVNLNVPGALEVATGGVIYANSAVHLGANYIALGLPFQPPVDSQNPVVDPFSTVGANPLANFNPTYGTGDLTVSANLIDIGYLSLQDIGHANFIADNGDIRGDGTLDIAGSVLMQAGQIYPATETVFTIAAYNYTDGSGVQNGSVTIEGAGQRELPLSAGGTLNIYASDITQDGVLVAPLGQINLGWNGSGKSPVDLITGAGTASPPAGALAIPTASNVTLGAGSVTSVSAVDPMTGKELVIPYGTNPDGTAWIDPSGVDITAGGVPQKSISISAINVSDQHGAVIDIRGGGDLLSYQFVPGIGGNNDVLASNGNYAILPGYQANYAPYDTDPGYNNAQLAPGDEIYLNASNGLAAGYYTLLPARYALLPGAFLVTPESGLPTGSSAILPDGGSLVSGYRYSSGESAAPLTTSFEVDSGSVVSSFAQYNKYYGSSYLANGAIENNQKVPRLPQDSGEVSFEAVSSLNIEGIVESDPVSGGLGGLVDISSPENIVITGGGAAPAGQSGALVLSANELSSFGAASLLIGGTRESAADGTTINVETANITLDNAGDPLRGGDIIIACTDQLTVDSGAEIEGVGSASGAQDVTVAGNGALLRVSSDPNVTVTRTGVTTATQPELAIDSGAKINGASITLDSSSGTNLSPDAIIKGQSVALNSGQISIELTNPGTNAPIPTATSGLILEGPALEGLFASAESLSFLSYSSIDIYGTGSLGTTDALGEAKLGSLTLSAGEIRGYNSTGGSVSIASRKILLENAANATDPGATASTGGTLNLNGDEVSLGANALAVDQFATVNLNGSKEMVAVASPSNPNGTSGSLAVQGELNLTTPLITGVAGAVEKISAAGALAIGAPTGKAEAAPVKGGLGASLTFTGASVTDNSAIALPSGSITLHATTGNLAIGNSAAASLDVSGASKNFFNVVRYTNGGVINLIADKGNVTVASDVTLTVAAQTGGGNAGTLSVSDPNGTLSLAGNLSGKAAAGQSGNFLLDVGTLATLGSLDQTLNAGSFDDSRTIEVQNGNVTVDGDATAANFNLSADAGSITVTGEINASDIASIDPLGNPISIGGTITLQAEGSVTLDSKAVLTAAAKDYSDAQQGGSISLEAGADINGVASSTAELNIEAGSKIDLTVAATPVQGDLGGTLLLRAPQTGTQQSPTGVQVGAIAGTITGASSVTVEGYTIYNTANDSSNPGSIDDQEGNVASNGAAFTANTGSLTENGNVFTATGMTESLVGGNTALEQEIASGATQLNIEPGAEIINNDSNANGGNLTLANTWDLAQQSNGSYVYRFGPNNNTAGILTLRAVNDVVFDYNQNSSTGASLSDGFVAPNDPSQTWEADLLPEGTSSWSYQITAGANFKSANVAAVVSTAALSGLTAISTGVTNGSVLVGYGAPQLPSQPVNRRSDVIPEFFETIRTGAGSIGINAGGDVQLLDNLATIYSAGMQAPVLANFTLPDVKYRSSPLGEAQTPFYAVQYTEYGGDVTIVAQNDIAHYVQNGSGGFQDDSSLEMPNNWLYRQGSIDTSTGQFASATSWWTDFSNFLEGVGSFGGGNVTLSAGNNISNVDAVIPTNFRMPDGTPDVTQAVELGGGNLVVSAGNDISGGVYYVERGQGTITAGGEILTNATRTTSGNPADSYSWLPTTLFAGEASFNISAGGNVLLGAVANPFLLPQGINNSYLNRSYFSTYAANDAVDVESLAGGVTIRNSVDETGDGSLEAFILNTDSQAEIPGSAAATYAPWLGLAESSVEYFSTLMSVMPGSLNITAFSGDIDVVGSIAISPAPTGTLSLLAGGSINALQVNGIDPNTGLLGWGTGVIDLSDADPANIPSVTTPIAGTKSALVSNDVLLNLNALFAETGSTQGAAAVIQTKEALHDSHLLHGKDTTPAYLYADAGSISGLTLYSSKQTDVIASEDITDDSFYIQNDNPGDISLVSAGRDIIPYDLNSALRLDAQQSGNDLLSSPAGETVPGTGSPDAGDLQVGGPGTLEVLAGRNLTLGVGANNPDGTAVGLTSIGNQRNPYLPFAGAEIVVAAGLGGVADGLDASPLDIADFVSRVLDGPDGASYVADLAGTNPSLDVTSVEDFKKLSAEDQAIAALDLFFIVLRDTGRDHNLIGNPGYGNYDAGYAAIKALLPGFGSGVGNIDTTSKEITTENGGDLSIIDPSGQLTVGVNLAGSQPLEQGIFTQDGGNISIYSQGSVNLGTSRIFTLHGGNIVIWSQQGDIDAGNSSKTVQSAPPTLVLVDPQSADVETNLAGLATGGGIGVLATVVGVPPGNVDLIAPSGVINAGDAGIRATGNLNLAAVQILNASNIQAGGSTSGAPTVTVAAPNLGALSAASSAAGATTASANEQANSQSQSQSDTSGQPSIIDVEVLGYGGGDGEDSGG